MVTSARSVSPTQDDKEERTAELSPTTSLEESSSATKTSDSDSDHLVDENAGGQQNGNSAAIESPTIQAQNDCASHQDDDSITAIRSDDKENTSEVGEDGNDKEELTVPQGDEAVSAVPEAGIEAVLVVDMPPSSEEQEACSSGDRQGDSMDSLSMSVGLVPSEVASFMSPNDFYNAWIEQKQYDDATTNLECDTDDKDSTVPQQSATTGEPVILRVGPDVSCNKMDATTIDETGDNELIPVEFASMGMTPEEYHEAWRQQVLRDDAKDMPPEVDFTGALMSSDITSSPIAYPPIQEQSIERERAVESPIGSAKKKRKILIGTIVAALVIIGGTVGLVLALTLGKDNSSSSPDTATDGTTTFAMVFIQPDRNPNETSWELRDSNGTTVYSQRSLEPRLSSHPIVVTRGENYTFSIRDAGMDGICCQSGLGYYYVLRANDGKRLVAGNGEFGGIAEREFVP